MRPLCDDALSERIRNLPRATLSSGAPKRKSLAGAQNKLLVVYRDDALFEPVGSELSTHILKPNHVSDDYPASVINEYFVMSLAHKLGLQVPPVFRRYIFEPVYIVERFDRRVDNTGRTHRRHIIDACQLLNKSRAFKYRNGEALGLPQRISAREIDRLARDLPAALESLVRQIEAENAQYPQEVRVFLGGDRRLISTIQHLVVPDMLERLNVAR